MTQTPASKPTPLPFLVAPSILSADFAHLARDIERIEKAGADFVHVDVMDGHFVPNLTIGAPVVKSLRPVTRLPLDVHLMIEQPERYVEDFAKAGADYLTIHVESTSAVESTLRRIRELKMKPGITLRPRTPLSSILPYVNQVDLILIMTVEPGFGGQSFMSDQVSKIKELRQYLRDHNLKALIEVDGGINEQTAKEVIDADVLVAGSYVFKNNVEQAIGSLKQIQRTV